MVTVALKEFQDEEKQIFTTTLWLLLSTRKYNLHGDTRQTKGDAPHKIIYL